MINVFGCDNEAVFLDIIEETVFKSFGLFQKKYAFHRFRNADELIYCLDNQEITPHLVIIDAHFDMGRTKECTQRLHRLYPGTRLILISSDEEDMFLSFEYDFCGFLHMLGLPEKLSRALALLLPKIDESSGECIQLTVYSKEKIPEKMILRYSEIMYFECIMKKVYVTFVDGSCYRVKCSLWRDIVQKFCMLPFGVPHQNYIVNMNYISKMTSTALTISPIGKNIAISKYRLKEFRQLYAMLPARARSNHFLP
ncbi:MAG: response regulator transcription factor [Oscillospiraceae bacterium]|nr:response regulator transcription factor [Oscillospiraceae bacterium]